MKILVVMLSAVGDAVHTLPVLTALKRAWPASHITWVIHPLPHTLVAGHPAVDEFIVFRRRRGAAAVGEYRRLRARFRGRRFDLCLSLQVYAKAGIVQAMAPADRKIGFDRARSRDLNWLVNSERIPARPPAHVLDQYLEFVRYLGVEPEPVAWGLEPTPQERRAQEDFFARWDRGPRVGLVLSASDPRRNWSPEGWLEVARNLVEDRGFGVLVLGGPSEREAALARGLDRGLQRGLPRHRSGDHWRVEVGDGLRRLLWLLDGCDLVISPDTGPLHMARAVGTPVIGLYGRTNPGRAGPWRAFHDLLVDGYADHPGEAYPPERRYRDGMSRITPAMVLEKVGVWEGRYREGRVSPGSPLPRAGPGPGSLPWGPPGTSPPRR